MTDLLAHLNSTSDPTEEEVQLYLAQRAREAQADRFAVMPAGQFWQEGDLAKFTALRDWWPRDAPPIVGRPYLGVMLRASAGPETAARETFGQQCERMWLRACEWLTSQGRDLANPNETKEERRRRKIREGVARHRQLNKTDDPRVAEVRRLHAEYIAACQARKAAAAVHDEDVAAALSRWERAKGELAADHN